MMSLTDHATRAEIDIETRPDAAPGDGAHPADTTAAPRRWDFLPCAVNVIDLP